MNKEYVVEKRRGGYRMIYHGFGLGIILVVAACIAFTKSVFVGIVVNAILFKLYFFKVIDFFFTKRIYKDDNNFYVKMACIKFKLTKGTGSSDRSSFIVIEDITVLSSGFTKFYGLVLVRNNPGFLDRIFKNKIKLYAEEDLLDLNARGIELAEIFDIEFIGRFEHQ